MPSPVGHVIGGLAAGWCVAGSPRGDDWRRRGSREMALFGALGALPDIDLMFGAHSGVTHSLGAAMIVGVAAWAVQHPWLLRSQAERRPRIGSPSAALFAMACMAAYGSHVLLDWLARDTTAPIGIMALWPFSRSYYESDIHLFMAISRRYYQGWTFIRQNAFALFRELLILMPVLMLVMLGRPRRTRAAQ
jgi:inner membrane protein